MTGRFPVSDRAGLQAYHRVAPYPLSLEEYRLADAHLRALNEDLARSLPTPSGVALAVETEGSHSSAFDRNALQLMALFQAPFLPFRVWSGVASGWPPGPSGRAGELVADVFQ